MLKVDVCEAPPHTVRSGGAKPATVENRIRTAGSAIGVRQDVKLGTRVDHRVHIKLVTARRSGEAGARSIVDSAPEAFGFGVLTTMIFTPGSDLDALRASSGSSGAVASLGMQDVFIVGMKT